MEKNTNFKPFDEGLEIQYQRAKKYWDLASIKSLSNSGKYTQTNIDAMKKLIESDISDTEFCNVLTETIYLKEVYGFNENTCVTMIKRYYLEFINDFEGKEIYYIISTLTSRK